MPLVIHPRVRTAILRLAVLTGFVVLAVTGTALAAPTTLASCAARPVSTPFAQWGDNSDYFSVPGGSFEGTADQVGWSLSNAELTDGNEPFHVNGADDDQSLTIDAGGTATSPYFCVDNTMPDLRFFAQEVMAGSDLEVNALVRTADGVTTVPVGDLADGSMTTWAPTPPMTGGSGSLADGQTVQVALQFVVPASSGSWQLDDVYVDPYRNS